MKTLHVFAVVLFLGNIITGLFWKAHADRTGDPSLMTHALHGIIRSDRWFTLPAAAVILVTGFAAAGVSKLSVFDEEWIWWSLVLFGLSGLAFAVKVAPLQTRMYRLALAGASDTNDFDLKSYKRLSLQWEIWGVFAILTPLAALVLMIAKPSF